MRLKDRSAEVAKGKRSVPMPSDLREYLVALKLRTGGKGLVFGQGERPFRPDAVRHRAEAAWRRAGLRRITLHECRHTFASLMIAAGVGAKSLSEYMGHANIAITFDRYGHLMPATRPRRRTCSTPTSSVRPRADCSDDCSASPESRS